MFRLVLLALVAVLSLAGVTGAAAAPPVPASGSFTYTSFTPSVRTAGGNTIIDYTLTATWTGTFSGTSIARGTLVIHADGRTSNHGSDTFTGTVNGVSGTVTFAEAGPGDATSFRNTDVVVSGTGGLAGLSGVLSAVGTVPPTGLPSATYTGRIHFGDNP